MFRKLLTLLSDSLIYGIHGTLRRLINLLLLPLLMRYLSIADFGVVFMLAIVAALFVPLANLGMTNAIYRYFNHSHSPQAQAQVLVTALASVIVTTLFLLVMSQLLAEQISLVMIGDKAATPLVRLTLVGATASSICAVFSVALRAARRAKSVAFLNVLRIIVSAGTSLILVIGVDMGVRGMVIGTLVADFVAVIAHLPFVYKDLRARANWQLWRTMLSYGAPFTPYQLQAFAVELLGIYLIRKFLGLEAAGLYGIAVRFATPISLVVNAVEASWTPYKFQIHAQDENPQAFFQSAFVYYMAGLTYLWVGISMWGPELMRWVTPPEFHSAALMIWATALIPAAHGVYYMSGTGFELGSNTRSMPLVSFLGLVTLLTGSFILIEPLGPLGAAVSTSLGWLAMSVTIYILSQRRFPIAYDWATIGAFMALAASFVIASYSIQTQPLAVRLAIITLLSVLFPILCILVLLRSRQERGRVQHLLTKLRLA